MNTHRSILVILLAALIGCFAVTGQCADNSGPTVVFDYSGNSAVQNPISDFMYFVPSISMVPVDSISSYGNNQMINIVSYKRDVKSKSFKTVVEFQIEGSGYHINTYDPEAMISENLQHIEEGKPLRNMLEYIKLEGPGGCIVTTKGRIEGGREIVEQMDVMFNTKNHKSSVIAGLYSVRPVDGKYEYQDCCDKITARIKSLTFKRAYGQATMKLEVDALLDADEKGDVFSIFKGSVANMLTKPVRIDNQGNDTMLDFGFALHQNQDAFTFPKAKNLTDERVSTQLQFTKKTN